MKYVRSTLLLVILLLILGLVVQESRHLYSYGHLFPLRLHADIETRPSDFGIEGVSKLYSARLTNYGPIPMKVTACDFVTDAGEKGVAIAYAVQRWVNSRNDWITVAEYEEATFCRPYPLGIAKARLFAKALWPGQSISTGEEASAARGGFQTGDSARFSVFPERAGEWKTSVSTASFRVDETPRFKSDALRILH